MQRTRSIVAALSSFVVLSASAAAQSAAPGWTPLHSGGWIASGTASVDRITGSGSSSATDVSVAPNGLAFVSPRFAVGGALDLGYAKSGALHEWTYGLGPVANYYFADPDDHLLPFLSASVIPTWQNLTLSNQLAPPGGSTGDHERDYELAIEGDAGLTDIVAPRIGITGEAFYTHFRTNTSLAGISDTQHRSEYGLRFGFTIFLH